MPLRGKPQGLDEVLHDRRGVARDDLHADAQLGEPRYRGSRADVLGGSRKAAKPAKVRSSSSSARRLRSRSGGMRRQATPSSRRPCAALAPRAAREQPSRSRPSSGRTTPSASRRCVQSGQHRFRRALRRSAGAGLPRRPSTEARRRSKSNGRSSMRAPADRATSARRPGWPRPAWLRMPLAKRLLRRPARARARCRRRRCRSCATARCSPRSACRSCRCTAHPSRRDRGWPTAASRPPAAPPCACAPRDSVTVMTIGSSSGVSPTASATANRKLSSGGRCRRPGAPAARTAPGRRVSRRISRPRPLHAALEGGRRAPRRSAAAIAPKRVAGPVATTSMVASPATTAVPPNSALKASAGVAPPAARALSRPDRARRSAALRWPAAPLAVEHDAVGRHEIAGARGRRRRPATRISSTGSSMSAPSPPRGRRGRRRCRAAPRRLLGPVLLHHVESDRNGDDDRMMTKLGQSPVGPETAAAMSRMAIRGSAMRRRIFAADRRRGVVGDGVAAVRGQAACRLGGGKPQRGCAARAGRAAPAAVRSRRAQWRDGHARAWRMGAACAQDGTPRLNAP